MQEVCPNCETKLTGKFCSNCGQKKITDKDMSVLHFFGDVTHWMTHFDSKFFISLKYIVIKPGFLVKEFFDKRRARYLSPIALFLLISLFLYLFGIKMHILHNFTLKDYLYEGSTLSQLVDNYCEGHAITREAFIEKFDLLKVPFQKLVYFLFIPIIAIASQILFFWKKRYFAEHLVFGIYYVCSYILLAMIYVIIVTLLQRLGIMGEESGLSLGLLTLAMAFYGYAIVKTAFSLSWWMAILCSLPLTYLVIYLDLVQNNWIVIHLTFLTNFWF